MTTAHSLGFPRIGAHRELTFAQESFWRGDITEASLRGTGQELRARHWALQKQAGLDYVSVGDFAWYDQVLNTLALLGALPVRFGFQSDKLTLDDYYIAAQGNAQHRPMEMCKWFDTNYHYLVPEWTADTSFDGGVNWLFEELAEADALGHRSKVTLIGPLTLLFLGKVKSGLDHALDLLPKIIPAYQKLLARLQEHGHEWLQIDEPILALDLDPAWLDAFILSYHALQCQTPKILLATYFDSVQERAALLHALPVAGIHLDLVRAPQQLPALLKDWPQDRILSAGIIDGRNIWRADLSTLHASLLAARTQLAERLWLAPSCSLLHVPVDLQTETALDQEIQGWLAFATQKLTEVTALKQALQGNVDSVATLFAEADQSVKSRRHSIRIHNPIVQKRLTAITAKDEVRKSAFETRAKCQQQRFALPQFPTSSIGSFPQITNISKVHAAYKQAEISHLDYLETMRAAIRHNVEQQEKIGIDVLVHGEPERTDMVEYFAEQLWGYGFTLNGWVQSHGSCCVKPPFIYGDIYRPEAMTVSWSEYAQSLSNKPVKGLLTGPVTMLQWSFVRDDQPRATTALQIALALREEVADLEKAGIGMIQIDEPAFRQGLPLKQQDWSKYLDWAVRAFKICSAVVRDDTQIHSHMCYAEFDDILPWIATMDADVISIKTAHADMESLSGFSEFAYPNDIGPGVYDTHLPGAPKVSDMQRLLQKARSAVPDARLWVNPDCGLNTCNWPEAIAALGNMVEAARLLRATVAEENEAYQDYC